MYKKMKRIQEIFLHDDKIPILSFLLEFLFCLIVTVALLFYFEVWPSAFLTSSIGCQIGLLFFLSAILTALLTLCILCIYEVIFFIVCVIEANKKDQRPQ